MRFPLRLALFFATLALAWADGPAWKMPPIEGEVAGDLTATLVPGAPPVHWIATAQKADERRRRVVLTVEGEGLRGRVECLVSVDTGDGEWKLGGFSIDLGRWGEPLAAKWGTALAHAQATGTLLLTGEGTLHGGVPRGRIGVAWHGGTFRDATAGWKLDGIAFDAALLFDAASGLVQSVSPVKVTVQTIATKQLGARNLSATLEVRDARTVALAAFSLEIAGGSVVAAPCDIKLQPFSVRTEVRFERVGLADVAQFVPNAVAEAHGRVDGQVELGWNAADGFHVGKGRLALRSDEPAELRLAPAPGLITKSLPADVLKVYTGLDLVETGQQPLQAKSLEVVYTPEGDAAGKQAFVHLTGTYPNARAPLDFTLNIRGPVGPLIKMSSDRRLHFGH